MAAEPRRLWCGVGGDGSGGDATAVVVRVASVVDRGEVVGAGGLAGEVVTGVMLMVAWRGDDGAVEVAWWQRGGDDDLGGGGWPEFGRRGVAVPEKLREGVCDYFSHDQWRGVRISLSPDTLLKFQRPPHAFVGIVIRNSGVDLNIG
ncbi:hypothetical protein Tco_0254992 [Tanacetum coccineum]